MNYIALNQTIFKKYGVIGKGFEGGDINTGSLTRRGYTVWINGVHELPETSKITQHYQIGVFQYPDLLIGMCDGGGEVLYVLGDTDKEYVLVAGVKLHEDPSEYYATDIAAFVRKDQIPIENSGNSDFLIDIATELLIAHFTHLMGTDEINDFKIWIEDSESEILKNAFAFYETNATEEVKQTLSEDPGT